MLPTPWCLVFWCSEVIGAANTVPSVFDHCRPVRLSASRHPLQICGLGGSRPQPENLASRRAVVTALCVLHLVLPGQSQTHSKDVKPVEAKRNVFVGRASALQTCCAAGVMASSLSTVALLPSLRGRGWHPSLPGLLLSGAV